MISKQIIERKVLLELLEVNRKELEFILFLFQEFFKKYNRNIIKKVIDLLKFSFEDRYRDHDPSLRDTTDQIIQSIMYNVIEHIEELYNVDLDLWGINVKDRILEINFEDCGVDPYFIHEEVITRIKDELNYWKNLVNSYAL